MSNKLKILLLLLLSLTSVFFAEIIAGSTKYPLLDLWGIIIVIPLYGLHTILLLYIIHKFLGNRIIMFSTLYFAGVIFGLYEGYMTKVLFTGFNDDSTIFMGIATIEYIVLVFFWHPLFAFIIPSLVFEAFMTKGSNLFEGLPSIVRRILKKKVYRVLLAILIGFYFSLNASTYLEAFLSGISLLIPLLIFYYVLRRKNVHLMYSLEDILPNYKTAKVLLFILLSMYFFLGITIDFKALSFSGQFMLWISYFMFGYMFFYSIVKNLLVNDIAFIKDSINFKYMIYYGFIIVFTGSLVSALWIFGVRDIFMIIFYISWIISGLFLIITTAKNLKENR